jgi:hypothetical protein
MTDRWVNYFAKKAFLRVSGNFIACDGLAQLTFRRSGRLYAPYASARRRSKPMSGIPNTPSALQAVVARAYYFGFQFYGFRYAG